MITGRIPLISPQKVFNPSFPALASLNSTRSPPASPCASQALRWSSSTHTSEGIEIEINSNPSRSRTSSNVTRMLQASIVYRSVKSAAGVFGVYIAAKRKSTLWSKTLLSVGLATTPANPHGSCRHSRIFSAAPESSPLNRIPDLSRRYSKGSPSVPSRLTSSDDDRSITGLVGASLFPSCSATCRGRMLALPAAASPDTPNRRKVRRLIVPLSSCILPICPKTEVFQSKSIRVRKERKAGIEELLREQRYYCQVIISTAEVTFYLNLEDNRDVQTEGGAASVAVGLGRCPVRAQGSKVRIADQPAGSSAFNFSPSG
jgi:hypothetical protein